MTSWKFVSFATKDDFPQDPSFMCLKNKPDECPCPFIVQYIDKNGEQKRVLWIEPDNPLEIDSETKLLPNEEWVKFNVATNPLSWWLEQEDISFEIDSTFEDKYDPIFIEGLNIVWTLTLNKDHKYSPQELLNNPKRLLEEWDNQKDCQDQNMKVYIDFFSSHYKDFIIE